MTFPDALRDPNEAAHLLHQYFIRRDERDGSPFYTGGQFERFAGGDRPDVADTFTVDDLVAVSMLSVTVPGRAALNILGPDAGELAELLAAIPTDVDLVDAEPHMIDDGSAANHLWQALRSQAGIGPVVAGKLLARKRPRLVPVMDSVVLKRSVTRVADTGSTCVTISGLTTRRSPLCSTTPSSESGSPGRSARSARSTSSCGSPARTPSRRTSASTCETKAGPRPSCGWAVRQDVRGGQLTIGSDVATKAASSTRPSARSRTRACALG
ncbi:hypothetical protein SAMN05216377_12326 [Pseudonocardia oroxyli]|uniref:Uncharacterized protein n=1 Tax=Pseudonocardia oroxyli TaxID=366584 RepID=A0A1G8CPT9_PSEOR|nr:hypothetical protein SAMN05216377_12326 [Pseudonocardia oroxyli]